MNARIMDDWLIITDFQSLITQLSTYTLRLDVKPNKPYNYEKDIVRVIRLHLLHTFFLVVFVYDRLCRKHFNLSIC